VGPFCLTHPVNFPIETGLETGIEIETGKIEIETGLATQRMKRLTAVITYILSTTQQPA
jgi:hypothetical protein